MIAFFESIINHSTIYLIGMVLVHFLWQATLVAIVFAAVGKLQRKCSSQTRYVSLLLGLLVMVAFPLMTFTMLSRNIEPGELIASDFPAMEPEFTKHTNGGQAVLKTDATNGFSIGNDNELAIEDRVAAASVSSIEPPLLSPARLKAILPWLVGLWTGGVVILALRLMFGFNRIRLWRRSATVISSPKMLEMSDRLCKRMRIKKPIRLLESIHNASPVVISWIRPAILIPASIVSGLAAREMEAILVHELAHIRRHDYLVNIAQAIVETVLFYHPAVWWLSNRIREEREHCCDDFAIDVCGDRKTFVRALAKLEEIRCHDLQVAVAANGGSLIRRMQRILDRQPSHCQSVWPAGFVALVSVLCVVAALFVSGSNSAAFADSSGADLGEVAPTETDEEDALVSSGITDRMSERMMDEENETRKGEIRRDGQQSGEAVVQDKIDLEKLMRKSIKNAHNRVREDQPGVEVLSSHDYKNQRTSTQSVKMSTGQKVDVGEGVAYDDKIIYLASTGEVVAVDSESGIGEWLIPQTKTAPNLHLGSPRTLNWQTVSVVNLDLQGKTQTAIELFAPKSINFWTATYLYYDIVTGELINFAIPDGGAQEWGPATEQGNLRLRLALEESEVKEGQPVLASLEIKNSGDTVESYDPQKFDAFRMLKVTDAAGKSDYYLASPVSTMGGPVLLQPGKTHMLWNNFDVGSLYMLDQGKYRIQAVATPTRNPKAMLSSVSYTHLTLPTKRIV